ncbi:MAG: tryptophan--tRNA ligase [Candidatus Pacebacteria bacterium]|nr:tryptophan--tRNA ligase [Candidatus Paceibacterota bacterium]
MATKPILVSGMQPSGRLHIGNYLGALKNFVELQDFGDYQCYFFIADLHSMTEPYEPSEKRRQIINLTADFLAAGIDPKKSVVFLQSLVPAHSELAWILNTITPMGELERMTQFKDKSARQEANVNAGLFTYPVLMAADILLYGTRVVPVGDDQLQHLELTRTVARKFNTRFGGTTFMEPKGLLTKTPRVMSLKDPSKKMSKSQPESCLFLDDEPEEIAAKIARAVTDSDTKIAYDPEKKPGLSNLLEIYAALTHLEPEAVAKEFSGATYAEFKKKLTSLVSSYFAEFRANKKKLMAKPNTLIKVLESGSKKAAKVADVKMAEVKKKVGLRA